MRVFVFVKNGTLGNLVIDGIVDHCRSDTYVTEYSVKVTFCTAMVTVSGFTPKVISEVDTSVGVCHFCTLRWWCLESLFWPHRQRALPL